MAMHAVCGIIFLIALTGCTIFTFVQHLQRHPTKFYSHRKKTVSVGGAKQHCVKWEAAGAGMSYSSSPILAYTAAGRSCLSWQPELPKELGQEQGAGAVSPFLLS